ncbi:MAG TPA: PIG-L family deacetylase [Polyangiaceae bacterium]|nr:PIG-L family deacetylase [Polyangiaceae bacterium]
MLLSCSSAGNSAAPRRGSLVVVAPHPDDEALISSGAILTALDRGDSVHVVILTNGDFDCFHDGLARQAESVSGLSRLRLPESNVHFLGYPDGYLARLGHTPLEPMKRQVDGSCTKATGTYGKRGAGGAEAHRVRTGSSAPYTSDALVDDLRSLLRDFAPDTLIVTHPEDTHPDHAAAYTYVRRAVTTLPVAPRILRAFVHNDDCWPLSNQPGPDCPARAPTPREATPALGGSLRGYHADVRWPVPRACRNDRLEDNPKLSAIFAHRSQVQDNRQSYLLNFARADEMFFSERPHRDHAGRWSTGPDPQRALGSSLVFEASAQGTPGQQSEQRAEQRGLEQRGLEQRGLVHHTPLVLSVDTARPTAAQPLRVSFLEGPGGHYELLFDGEAAKVRLLRKRAGAQAEIPLQEWLLPHDVWTKPREVFRLQVARAETIRAFELSLWLGDDFVGQAIDVEPLERGDRVGLEAAPVGGVELRIFE